MQHLEDTHRFPDITVYRVIKKDYYGTADCTFRKFINFPARAGYTLKHNYTLIRTGITDLPDASEPLEQEQLLQTWLFFGLIYTVVSRDNRPILVYDDLLSGQPAPNNFIITTRQLNQALSTWQDHMETQARINKDAAKLRMMRVEYVLQLARSVVKANCAADGLDIKPGEYGVKDHGPLHLSLMILGETLASTKSLILARSPILSISGWHSEDADEGWGPSRTIDRKFQADAWCPRTVNILRSQLKSNATLMYAAYLSYNGSEHRSAHAEYISRASDQDRCTPEVCKFKSERIETGQYVTNAIQRHHDHNKCEMIGPDMEAVIKILTDENPNIIPLLEISVNSNSTNPESVNQLEFRVERFDSGAMPDAKLQPSYAAISHVWSDGWGNESENKLWTCQLRFIYDMLRSGAALANSRSGTSNSPNRRFFWMDTLVIPVDKDQGVIRAVRDRGIDLKTVKKKAIRQIYKVFEQSEFTIVLDNGLSYLTRNDDAPCQTAMRILASGWMKRLWTLQEAYVSRRLYVAFNNHGGDSQPMIDFRTLVEVDLTSRSGVIASTKRHLTESIMFTEQASNPGSEQQTESAANRDMEIAREGYRLIVGAWKAARFRTTSNSAHETLALATLLNLAYAGTPIDEAGLTQGARNRADLDGLAQGFWDLFERKYPRSIPSGFIFLPGDKLGIMGYGWAPRTFLNVFEAGYPDPLPPPAGIFRGTELHRPSEGENPLGLRVQYPGFLLHCRNGKAIREKILGRDNMKDILDKSILTFPTNASLLDWFQVRPTGNIVDLPSSISKHRTQLAIILTRPDPKEKPREIGLLVEIYKNIPAHRDRSRQTFCCQIIRQVLVNRYSRPTTPLSTSQRNGHSSADVQQPHLLQLLPNDLFPLGDEEDDDDLCIGETLDVDQEWFVDGFHPSREKGLSDYELGTSERPEEELNNDNNMTGASEDLNRSDMNRGLLKTVWRWGRRYLPGSQQPSPALPRVRTDLNESQSSRPPGITRRETAPVSYGPPRRVNTLDFL